MCIDVVNNHQGCHKEHVLPRQKQISAIEPNGPLADLQTARTTRIATLPTLILPGGHERLPWIDTKLDQSVKIRSGKRPRPGDSGGGGQPTASAWQEMPNSPESASRSATYIFHRPMYQNCPGMRYRQTTLSWTNGACPNIDNIHGSIAKPTETAAVPASVPHRPVGFSEHGVSPDGSA